MRQRPDPRELMLRARREGRSGLLEPEGLELLSGLGIPVPLSRYLSVETPPTAQDLEIFEGDELVLKVVSAELAHKSDVGGVGVVPRELEAVSAARDEMLARLSGWSPQGILLQERVLYDASPGGELLAAVRWSEDFGFLLALGPGGLHAELLARELRAGRGLAMLSAELAANRDLRPLALRSAFGELAATDRRGAPPRFPAAGLAEILQALRAAARELGPLGLRELEINPLVARRRGGPVALDVLVRCGPPAPGTASEERPLEKLGHLLRPERIALIGVSSGRNPGRVILENLLRQGFDRERISIIKPGREQFEGCRCFGSISGLPSAVDLLVVSVAASEVPAVLKDVITGRKAESLIVIPGGLGEKRGSEGTAEELEGLLRESRRSEWKGPLVNGGNCLGIRSGPGGYDTFFLPEHKLAPSAGSSAPVGLISQSGAFCAARMDKLERIDFRYAVSLGNQLDLTVGDYLTYWQDDEELPVLAVYLEGFRSLDGLAFLRAARRVRRRGGTVLLYRAGRTPAGRDAAASHTAAVAGDYEVTRQLAEQAGVVVAESIEDFEDLLRLFALLARKKVAGRGLAALSNAGFECVAIPDGLELLQPAQLQEATVRSLRSILEGSRVDRIVDVRNPMDVTPMAGDEAFARAAEVMLGDPGVDVGVVGCVPLTPALETLAPGAGHQEEVAGPRSVATRLVELFRSSEKAWVAVVDGGPRYDEMARVLEEGGLPVFRTADRAVRLLEIFCRRRLAG